LNLPCDDRINCRGWVTVVFMKAFIRRRESVIERRREMRPILPKEKRKWLDRIGHLAFPVIQTKVGSLGLEGFEVESHLRVIKPVHRSREAFFVMSKSFGVNWLLPHVMDKYKGRRGKELLEIAVDQLWGATFLVIHVVNLPKGVHKDDIGLDILTCALESLVLSSVDVWHAKRRGKEPPDILRRGAEEFESFYYGGFRCVYLKVKYS
jgi:hypothetical protein